MKEKTKLIEVELRGVDLLYTQCGCCSLLGTTCSGQADNRRSKECFGEFSGLLCAHEMISIKMRMDLATGGATEDAEPKLGLEISLQCLGLLGTDPA